MRIASSLLMSTAALSFAFGLGAPVGLALAQTDAQVSGETEGSSSVDQARRRVEEARQALEQAQADGDDTAAAEAELADAEAELAAAEQAAATEPAPADEMTEEDQETRAPAEEPVDQAAPEEAPAAAEPAPEVPADESAGKETSAEDLGAVALPPAETIAEEQTGEPPASAETPVAQEQAAPDEEQTEPTPEQRAVEEGAAAPGEAALEEEPVPEIMEDGDDDAPEPDGEQSAAEIGESPEPADAAPAREEISTGADPAAKARVEEKPTAQEAPAQTQGEQEQPAPERTAPARRQEAEAAEEAEAEELSPEALEASQQASGEQAVEAAAAAEAEKSEEQRDREREDRLRILGAAAAGAVVGALIPELGGRLVGQEGDRVIIQQGDEFVVRKDEIQRLLTDGSTVSVEELAEGRTQVTVTRPDGTQVITLRDAGGHLLRRVRRLPNGDEVVLFDERATVGSDAADLAALPQVTLDDRRNFYLSGASQQEIEQALLADPIRPMSRAYTLREVRETDRLRWQMPGLQLDALTFETNSADLGADQLNALDAMGRTLSGIIERRPDEVFLIEGHTDAVGADLHNLALSDRRAESVAALLTRYYDVPPENVVTQGYGEHDLTVPTLGPSRENRRVAVRRITPLLK